MKSKGLQKIVLSKYQNGDTPTRIYRDLNSAIGLRTIEKWRKITYRSGTVTVSNPPGCSRLTRTKENIQQIPFTPKERRISARKLSMELGISQRSVWQIMKNDLELRSYKIVIEPLLSDDQTIKRKKLAN